MIDQKHIINKQVLEVRLSSKKDAHLIQDAFSKAYRNNIIPIIERIADQFTPNGEIITIDKLEVDVGGISIDNLYNDFPQIFVKNMEEKLIEKLHNGKLEIISSTPDFTDESKKTVSIKTDLENSEEVLNYFLLAGTLPWWSSKNIQEVAEELLDKSPDRVKLLLLKLLRNQSIRKRFVYQFPEKTITKSLLVLTPNAAPFLFELIEKFTAVQSIHPFINLSQNAFKEEIWNSILSYTAEYQAFLNTNPLNEIELTDQIFSRLIIQTGNESISTKDLYNFLSKISDSIILSKQQIQSLARFDSNINTLLNTLREDEISEDLMADSLTHSKSDDKAQIELFTYFLQTGRIPFNDGKYSDSSIQLVAEELLENSPENVRILLLNQLTDIAVRKRFIHQFSDEFIFKTLEILIPSAASSAVELIKTINKIESFHNIPSVKFREDIWSLTLIHIINNQQSINNNGIESISQILIKHLIQISNGNISLREIQKKIELLKKTELLEEDTQKSIEPKNISDRHNKKGIIPRDNTITTEYIERIKESDERDYAFGKNHNSQPEIESKYIGNAGLALLWPFLNIFFVRLNIVKNKKFVSHESAQRAVHLIQYLVTEKEETPEHDMLFNKLLCGFDIYEPIPLGFKITDIEKEECNALLQSVIDNWTVLKNTSIQAIRFTFLQKEGILSKQSNGWKLAIERTTVDVLLDKLPWSISMISLPWNNEMIYVEW